MFKIAPGYNFGDRSLLHQGEEMNIKGYWAIEITPSGLLELMAVIIRKSWGWSPFILPTRCKRLKCWMLMTQKLSHLQQQQVPCWGQGCTPQLKGRRRVCVPGGEISDPQRTEREHTLHQAITNIKQPMCSNSLVLTGKIYKQMQYICKDFYTVTILWDLILNFNATDTDRKIK